MFSVAFKQRESYSKKKIILCLRQMGRMRFKHKDLAVVENVEKFVLPVISIQQCHAYKQYCQCRDLCKSGVNKPSPDNKMSG